MKKIFLQSIILLVRLFKLRGYRPLNFILCPYQMICFFDLMAFITDEPKTDKGQQPIQRE